MKKSNDILMYTSSMINSDLYYATKFSVGDPIIFFRIKGKKYIVASDLEIGRARKEAEVDRVLSLSKIENALKKNGIESPQVADFITYCLKERKIKKITVNASFPVSLADKLRRKGLKIFVKEDPFFDERIVKKESEIEAIRKTMQKTEKVLWEVFDILKRSKIKGNRIYYNSTPLTSEFLRRYICVKLLENDCFAESAIVVCGNQGCDPHNIGFGPLEPHKSIIFDIYPRSLKTKYYADMTRTFVKGKPPDELFKLFETVKTAQQKACDMIRDGVNGFDVHNMIVKFFEENGYKRKGTTKRPEGFIHGTGHGLGLDVHEPPRISTIKCILKQNNVITVEPGLYYYNLGCVRIEDIVVVRKNHCENLNKFPKIFVIE